MAKITVKQVPPTKQPRSYVLELSQAELDIIVAAIGITGGYDGPNGYRPVLDALWRGIRVNASYKNVLNASNNGFPSGVNRTVPPGDLIIYD